MLSIFSPRERERLRALEEERMVREELEKQTLEKRNTAIVNERIVNFNNELKAMNNFHPVWIPGETFTREKEQFNARIYHNSLFPNCID